MGTIAAGLFAGRKVFDFFKDSITEAREAQKVFKLTAAVLKSTGGAAHVSAKQVDDLANSLSAISGIDDEVIASAENVLLTFRDVRNETGKGNDIFNQGTKAALDLSVALGQDLQSSVIQVGKALNDPIKGMTALRRVGVSFTEQQIKTVKELVASNDLLGAQKIILGELTKEFGGAAAAAASPWDKMKVAIKNLEESIGKLLLPVLDALANFMSKTLVPVLQNTVIPAVLDFFHKIRDVGEVLGNVFGPILRTSVQEFFRAFHGPDGAPGAATDLELLRQQALNTANGVITMNDVIQSFTEDVAPVLGDVLASLGSVFGSIARGAVTTATFIFEMGQTASHVVRDIIGAFEAFGRFLDGFIERFRLVFQGMGNIIGGLYDIVRDVFGGMIAVAGGFLRFFAGFFTGNIKAAINGLIGAFGGIGRAVAGAFAGAVRVLAGIAETIIGVFSGIVSAVFRIGSDVVGGFINGIASRAGDIIGAVKRFITDKIPEFLRSFFGIHSPSTLMFKLGANVGDGFKLGISASLKDLSLASSMQGLTDLNRINVPAITGLSPAGASSLGGRVFGPGSVIINTQSTDPRVLANELAFKLEQESRR